MRFRRHLKLEAGSLDITPLIDVVFLLLVFFMLTSSFIVQPSIKVNLPRVKTGSMTESKKREITIDSTDTVYVGKKQVDIKELQGIVHRWASSDPNTPVLIRGDRDATLGRIVQVWDICKAAGITKLRIGTEISPER